MTKFLEKTWNLTQYYVCRVTLVKYGKQKGNI